MVLLVQARVILWSISVVEAPAQVAAVPRTAQRPPRRPSPPTRRSTPCTLLPPTRKGLLGISLPTLLVILAMLVVQEAMVTSRRHLRRFHRCQDIRIRGPLLDCFRPMHLACKTSIGSLAYFSCSKIYRSERKASSSVFLLPVDSRVRIAYWLLHTVVSISCDFGNERIDRNELGVSDLTWN